MERTIYHRSFSIFHLSFFQPFSDAVELEDALFLGAQASRLHSLDQGYLQKIHHRL